MAWFYSNNSAAPLHRAALEDRPPRVVSFLGAATEIVCLLGCENFLVGRSHECRRPESILSLPCVSSAEPIGADLDSLSSREIDERVKGLVEKGLARYKIDVELLKSLEPDVILTQDQCSVCAITPQDLEAACSRFFFGDQKPCRIVSLHPKTMSDVWENVNMIASALGVSEKGDALIWSLQAEWDLIRRSTPEYNDGMPPLNVACLQWTDPLIGAGYWVPEILSCAGGVNLLGERGGGSPVVTLESLAQAQPEVIVVMCCGLDLDRGVSDVEALEKQEGWLGLRPVSNGRVYVVNGDKYFNTSSAAAAVESARLIAEILHGGRSGLEGTAYVRRPALPPPNNITTDVTTPPNTAIAVPRPPLLLPEWLQNTDRQPHVNGDTREDNGAHFGGLSPEGEGVNRHVPEVGLVCGESPISTPRTLGFEVLASTAATPPWGGTPMGSSPGVRNPPGEHDLVEDFLNGNDSDEEGWGEDRGLFFGEASDSDDSDDDFEDLIEVPLGKWSLEKGDPKEGLELTQGLVLDSDLEAIAERMKESGAGPKHAAGSENGVKKSVRGTLLKVGNADVTEEKTGYSSRLRAQPQAVPPRTLEGPAGRRWIETNPESGLTSQEPNLVSGLSWQEPRVLSPDSLKSSPTQWHVPNSPLWPETPRTPQSPDLTHPDSLLDVNSRAPFGMRRQTEVFPSRFAEEAVTSPNEEKGVQLGGFKQGSLKMGRGFSGGETEAEESSDKDGTSSSQSRTNYRRAEEKRSEGEGVVAEDEPNEGVQSSKKETGKKVKADPNQTQFALSDASGKAALVGKRHGLGRINLEGLRSDKESSPEREPDATGLTLFEGPHSPYNTTADASVKRRGGVLQGFESIALDSARDAEDEGIEGGRGGALERGGSAHSAFKRIRPMGRPLALDVGRRPEAGASTLLGDVTLPVDDVILPVSDVSTPSERPLSPPEALGEILSPMVSRPRFLADLLDAQTSPPPSPVRTAPMLRTAHSASPPRSPSSPPNFFQAPNPVDLPALLDLGSVPAVKTLTPIRTGRQFTPLPSSPPFAPAEAPKISPAVLPLELPRPTGQLSPSSPSSPSLSPLSSPLGNGRRLENGTRPPKSPRSPQTLASPRFSPLSVLPYLTLDIPQDVWLPNLKILNPAEFVEETGLAPMETLAGGLGFESDVTSLEDDIRGSMDRWMWGEIGMEGVTAAAGLDAVQSATSNHSVADSPSTKSSEPNSLPSDALEGIRMPALTTKAQGLREVLEEAIKESLPADCIILSGGLDTCIIAEVAAGMAAKQDRVTASGRNKVEAIRGSDVSLDEPAKEDFTFHWGSKPMKQAEEYDENKRIEDHARTSVHPHSDTSLTTPSSKGNSCASESSGFDAQTPRLLLNPLSAPGRNEPSRQTEPPDESGNGSHYKSSDNPKVQQNFKEALTVLTGEHATDRPYAMEIARRCGLQHTVIETRTPEELLETELDFVVRTLRTFDPMGIRNSIAVAAALREAERRGCRTAITGDGADEMLGGYSFTHGLSPNKFEDYRQHLKRVMDFSAVPLGKALGIEVRQPYLFPKVVDYALSSLAREDLVGPVKSELLTEDVRRGVERFCRPEDLGRLEGGVTHGKLALREAFPGVYSAWRSKDPIEVGCGTTILPARLKEALSEADLAAAQKSILEQDLVKIRDAEHLYYYRAFRRVFGSGCPPGIVRWGSDPCIACGFQLQQPTQTFCVVCGEYPARKPVKSEGGGDVGGREKKSQGDMKTTNNVESEEGLGESGAKRRENGEGGNVDTRGGEEGLEKSGHKERGKGGIGKVATKGIGGLETKAQAGGDKAGRAGADGAKGKGVESVDAVREIKGRIAEALEGAGQGPLAHGTVAADASAVGASGERETEERPDVNREASRAPPSRTLSADSTDDYADASETLDEPIDG